MMGLFDNQALFGMNKKDMVKDISRNFERIQHLRKVLKGVKDMVSSNNSMLVKNNNQNEDDNDLRLRKIEEKIETIHQKVCDHENTYKAIQHTFGQKKFFTKVCEECGKELLKHNLDSKKGKRAFYKHLRQNKEKSVEEAREQIDKLNKKLSELENEQVQETADSIDWLKSVPHTLERANNPTVKKRHQPR